VVVGAGLAASAALTDRGVDHLVLERARVAETWHTQRWDSFRLNTPVTRSVISSPDTQTAVWFLDALSQVRLSGEQTGGPSP
jgi:cation diffusion facilitator CzcD-associated flavoprotein CzcO